MRFGGRARFGTAKFGGDPYGWDPGWMLGNVAAVLRRFTKEGGDTLGRVKSVERLTSQINEGTYAELSTRGVPAYYLGIEGGTFKPHGTSGRESKETVTMFCICVAGAASRSRQSRLEGDPHKRVVGLDDLTRWALFWTTQTLLKSRKLKNVRPAAWRYLQFAAERFVSVVQWKFEISNEFYEDVGTLRFDSLGISHTPRDLSVLFDTDDETPLTVEGQPETPNVVEINP